MANREHLQVLEQGVEAWNAWRNAHENVKPDLSGANLSGGKYEGINFSGVDLRETNLRCARLREANLTDASLEKADLSQAVLENARLEWADLFEADLRETRLFGACLRETNLGKANLSRADLGEVDLQKAILNEAYLSKARLVGADLRGANLSKANLYRADLSGANLQGADLHEAVLSRSRLVNADLRGARITAVNLIRAQLQEADLSEADLSYADLSHSRVRGLVADNAILEETTQSSLIVAEEKEIVVTVGHVELVSHVTHMLQNGAAGEFPPGLLSRIVLVINCMATDTAEPINAVEQALGEQHLLPVIVHLGETARQQSLTWAQRIARVAAGVVILGEEAAAYTPVIEGLAQHSSPRAIRVLRFNQSPEHSSAGISSNSRNSSEREDRQATVETFPAVEVMDVSTPERLSQALSGLSLAPAEVGETPPIPPAQEQKMEPHLDQASPMSQNNEPVPPSPEGSPSPASEPTEEDIIAIPVPENSSAQEVEATTAGEVEEIGELPSEQTGAEVPPVPHTTALPLPPPARVVITPDASTPQSSSPRGAWLGKLLLVGVAMALLGWLAFWGWNKTHRDVILLIPAATHARVFLDDTMVPFTGKMDGELAIYRASHHFIGKAELKVYFTQLSDLTSREFVRYKLYQQTLYVEPKDSALRQVVHPETLYTVKRIAEGSSPHISADGRQVVYIRFPRKGSAGAFPRSLYIYDLTSGTEREVVLRDRSFYQWEWDRPILMDGGEHIYLSAYRSGKTYPFLISTATGRVTRIPVAFRKDRVTFIPLPDRRGLIVENRKYGLDGSLVERLPFESPFPHNIYAAGSSGLIYLKEADGSGRRTSRLDCVYLDFATSQHLPLFKVFKGRLPFLSAAQGARRVVITEYSGLSVEFFSQIQLWEAGQVVNLTNPFLDGDRTFADGASFHQTQACADSTGRVIVYDYESQIYLLRLHPGTTIADLVEANLPERVLALNARKRTEISN